MPYLVTPTGATKNHVVYVFGYSFAINSAKTVKSLTLPNNRNVMVLAIDVSARGATPVRVNLAAVDNVAGIVTNGTAAANVGWNNSGYAYSASLLGTSITSGGFTYTLGAPGSTAAPVAQTLQISGTPATTAVATVSDGMADAVSNTTIPLPAGNYATLNLLGAAAYGAQMNQKFVVTYTDGTTTTITQSLSDWWGPPQNYAGESQVLHPPYIITPTGATLNVAVYVYGYTLAINSAKTVKSLTLPANRNVVILAVDVTATSALPAAASPTFSPAPGSYTSAQSVTLSDTTPGWVIHYTTNGTTPTVSSATYSAPIAVGSTETIQAMAVASGYANSTVASGSYVLTTGGTTSSVNLSAVYNVTGIASNGIAASNGGWDNS